VAITVVFKTTHGCSIQPYADTLVFVTFKEVSKFLVLLILFSELFNIAPANRMSTFITLNVACYFLPSHWHPEVKLILADIVKFCLYVLFAYIFIFILNYDYKFLIALYMNLYMHNFKNKL
jgi:hypothetical protein